MDWIFQSTGVINHYNEKIHIGAQPVRVLHHMNLYMFQNTHPTFSKELSEAFDKHGLSKTINIFFEEEAIKNTPFIRNDNKSIYIHETFLSYLWCISHAIYTLYILEIDHPRLNQQAGYAKYPISQDKIDKAYELFDYARLLIKSFDKWNINSMPNPEKYLVEDRDFIEQPNIFYTEAIKFILCHEYIHAIKHIDKINSGEYEQSHYIDFEKEADYEAIELMKKGIFHSKINELPIHIGLTIGLLSMFFFRPTTTAKKHPNTEDRLVLALEQLNLDDTTPCWGIALVGFKLWSDQFNHDLKWNVNLSDKKAFYDLIKQIKEF